MKRPPLVLLGQTCIVMSMLGPSAGAQQKPPAQIAVRVDVVALDVEVLDAQGNPVTNLQRGDFAIRENDIPREISSFAWASGRTVSLTVLLDTSAVTLERLSIAKEYILLLAHLLAPEDEVCLYSFDYRDAFLEQDFTIDRPVLVRALENIGVTPGKKRSFLENLFGKPPRAGMSIDMAMLNASRGRNQRKALILISNRFQGLGPATVEHVRETGMSVLLLNLPGGENGRDAINQGGSSPGEIARESGGREFLADASNITGVCRSIASSLKNHYTITYATEIGSPERTPRRIDVTVAGRDFRIHTRRSYTPAP